MPATDTLIRLLSSGNDSWFAQCRWCVCPSPSVDSRDDLRVLAAAKAAGWTVRDGDGGEYEGSGYIVVCRPCNRVRYAEGE